MPQLLLRNIETCGQSTPHVLHYNIDDETTWAFLKLQPCGRCLPVPSQTPRDKDQYLSSIDLGGVENEGEQYRRYVFFILLPHYHNIALKYHLQPHLNLTITPHLASQLSSLSSAYALLTVEIQTKKRAPKPPEPPWSTAWASDKSPTCLTRVPMTLVTNYDDNDDSLIWNLPLE